MSVGEHLINQRRRAGAQARRDEARRLRSAGLSRREIARRLGCSVSSVSNYLWQPCMTLRLSAAQLSRLEKAQAMARVYPDEERRRWIYRQMGLEYPSDGLLDRPGATDHRGRSGGDGRPG